MFSKVLDYVTKHVRMCNLKEKSNKRYLRISGIRSVEQAVSILNDIEQ